MCDAYAKSTNFGLDAGGPDGRCRRGRRRGRRCGRRNRKRSRRRSCAAHGSNGAQRRQPKRRDCRQIEPMHQCDQAAGPVVVVLIRAAESVLL